MGICVSKSQAKSVVTSATVKQQEVVEQKEVVVEEHKEQAHPNRKKYVRARKKISPKATEGTEEHETIPLFGHQLILAGAPAPQPQTGFEDKPLNIVTDNFSVESLTRAGIGYACKKGLKPESPNQDDFCIMLDGDTILLGVFDGHGPCGHLMSDFVHTDLPKLVIGSETIESDPIESLKASFPQTHERLKSFCHDSNGEADCSTSGTTASIVLIKNLKVYVAHVGDSRIVMAKKTENRYEAVQLTEDHKPTLPDEKLRIENAGGEVKKLPYDIPYRVFVKGTEDPGLSMSRSIGDTMSQSIGVTCEPDVKEVPISDSEEFILICSDGVWEFIKNEEAVELVGKFTKATAKQGAEKLAQLAWMRWLHNEGEVVDDITVIVSFIPKS